MDPKAVRDVKLLGDAAGMVGSGIAAIFAAGETTVVTYSAVVALLGFAGLLVRQLVTSQRLYIDIVAAKDREVAERDDTIHYLRWEAEVLRYRHGERQIDPGPYVPRRPPTTTPELQQS